MEENELIVEKAFKLGLEARTKLYNILRFPKEWMEQTGAEIQEIMGALFLGLNLILLSKSPSDDYESAKKLIMLLESVDDSLHEDISKMLDLKAVIKKFKLSDMMEEIRRGMVERASIPNLSPIHDGGIYDRLHLHPIKGQDHLEINVKKKFIQFDPYPGNIDFDDIVKLKGKFGLQWNIQPISYYYPGHSIGIRGVSVGKEDIFSKSAFEDNKRYSIRPIVLSKESEQGWLEGIIQDFQEIKTHFEFWRKDFQKWFDDQVDAGKYRADQLSWNVCQPLLQVERFGMKHYHLFTDFSEKGTYSETKQPKMGYNYIDGMIPAWCINRYLDGWDMSSTGFFLKIRKWGIKNENPAIVVLNPLSSEKEIEDNFSQAIEYLNRISIENLPWSEDSPPPSFEDRLRDCIENKLRWNKFELLICPNRNCEKDLTIEIYTHKDMFYEYACPQCRQHILLNYENNHYSIIKAQNTFPKTSKKTKINSR